MRWVALGLCVLGHCWAYQRLSKDVYPTEYYLTLWPNMTDLTYRGHVRILLGVRNESKYFSLDWEDLSLNVTTSALSMEGVPLPATFYNVSLNASAQRLQVYSQILVSKMEFEVSFAGHIRKDLSGFYLSSYTHNGVQRYLASTQFESSSARKAFPCFDEPSFRSDFTLELVLDQELSAISNSPILSDDTSDGKRRVVFSKQSNIPTYLTGWVVYTNDSFVGTTAQGGSSSCSTSYTVWSSREFQGQHNLSLSKAPQLVHLLENYTGIECKAVRTKVDLVAIPDFSAGAMENWGLITFRESALLYDESYSSVEEEQRIVMVLAHELAHQWFGNLVTPDWWTHLWLSEGFARYLQYFITDQLLPEFRLADQFVVDRRQLALEEEALPMTSRPLTNYNITNQSDINDMFDVITYDKGASVIHMMSSFLGSGFRDGIHHYLTSVEGSGGVTTTDTFFETIPGLLSMKGWTETAGYPVVVASEENSTLSLKQVKITDWNQTEESFWNVPLAISSNIGVSSHILEANKKLQLSLKNMTTYLINANQTGYYRVMYTNTSRWMAEEASPIARSLLIDDVMALAYAGLVPYSVAMETAKYHLMRELDFVTWRTGLRTLSALSDLLDGDQAQTMLHKEILGWMGGVIDYIAFNNTEDLSPSLKLHQMNVLRHACMFRHEACIKHATQIALNISESSAEKRSALLCTAVREGSTSTWNDTLERYYTSKSPAERQLYLTSLACTKDTSLVERLLANMFLDLTGKSRFRRHDLMPTVSLLCSTKVGATATYEFFRENLEKIFNNYGEMISLKKLFMASKCISESELEELKAASTLMPELGLEPLIPNLEKSMIYKRKVAEAVKSYLVANPGSSNSTTTPGPPVSTDPNLAPHLQSSGYTLTLFLFITLCVFANMGLV